MNCETGNLVFLCGHKHDLAHASLLRLTRCLFCKRWQAHLNAEPDIVHDLAVCWEALLDEEGAPCYFNERRSNALQ